MDSPVTPFQLAAVFVSLVAVGSWINARTARLPREVAMMLIGLAGALTLWMFQRFAHGAAASAAAIGAINRIDFADTVLGYMLGFLLFAGAMQVDLGEMRKRLVSVSVLATAGVVASIIVVGFGLWSVARALALPLSLPWALVFGALISPTDPIAVLAAVKRGHLSKSLQAIMQGEALFNDGVGIVAFTSLVAFAAGEGLASPVHLLGLVFVQAAGGLILGLASGLAVIRAMRAIDDFAVEVTLSIALCMGVYAGAQALGLSGPIGVVGAGLLIDGERARGAMRGETHTYLKNFWTLVDEILNAILFLLLGFETLVVPFQPGQIGLAVASILLVLFARICVVAPWAVSMGRQQGARRAAAVMVWGGLHGALSLALALSIPQGPERSLILSATYAVVAFSMIVQGLTFGPLTAALKRGSVDV
jgi:CPA1 family monovalent cation:H+ antiporter